MLKLKFTWKLAILDVTNSNLEAVIFDLKGSVRDFRFEIGRLL